MPVFNKEITTLSTLLHTSDTEKRTVIYYALGEVLISNLIRSTNMDSKDYEVKMRISVKKIVDSIGELAIIDRSLFENTLINILKYKLFKPDLEGLRTDLWNPEANFFMVIGLTRFYSLADIECINKHFKLYRDAMLTMLNAVKHLSSEGSIPDEESVLG